MIEPNQLIVSQNQTLYAFNSIVACKSKGNINSSRLLNALIMT